MNISVTSNEIQKESKIFKLASHFCQSTSNSKRPTLKKCMRMRTAQFAGPGVSPSRKKACLAWMRPWLQHPTPHNTRLSEKVCSPSTGSM